MVKVACVDNRGNALLCQSEGIAVAFTTPECSPRGDGLYADLQKCRSLHAERHMEQAGGSAQ